MVTGKTLKDKLNLEQITWNGFTWIDVVPPSPREAEYLAAHFPFHPLDLDDTMSRIQRPKIDEYSSYLFFVFNFPRYNKEERALMSSQVSAFIGPDYVVTLHNGELKPLVKLFKECQLDEESRKEYMGHGSAYLLYRILDRLVDYCLPILSKVEDNLESIEDILFKEKAGGEITREISRIRRDIIVFRRIIWPMRSVAASLEPKLRRFTTEDLSVYFGDLVDHLDRIWDDLGMYKEIGEGLSDTTYILSTERTNEVIRLLTVIATIMMPITVVASVYGMNVTLPFQNSDYAFLYVILITLAIIGGMLYFFKRIHII